MKTLRKMLGVAGIVVSGTAISVPDPTISAMLIALGSSLNAAALFLLKDNDEKEEK